MEDEVIGTDKTALIKRSYGALVHAVRIGDKEVGHMKQVPTFLSVSAPEMMKMGTGWNV